MGGERSSKEEKRKRRSSPSAAEDEGRRKRRKDVEDEERKRSKSDKKEKAKKKKSHKHSKHHSDKEKKSGGKHKDKHHKRDRHAFQELSNDDYFLKNNEFATWLKDERKIFFSDLSSESARELFSHFVKDWNNQKLEPRYYEGIESGLRTAHNWKIKQ